MADETPHELEDLLPLYVNGRASAEERAAVEAAVAENPNLAEKLAFLAEFPEALAPPKDDWSPGALGLQRLRRDIRAATGVRGSVWAWRAAAAAAIALLLLQNAAWLVSDAPVRDGYGTATDAAADARLAQITFAETATEREIRQALRAAGARFVDGPSALGVYRIIFEDDAARDAGIAALGRLPIVETASEE